MPYYMGDYYGGGGYYKGDPGIFSFLGGLAKRAVGFIPGVGPIAQQAIEGVGALIKRPGVQRTGKVIGSAIIKHPVLTAAGAVGAAGVLGRMSAPGVGGMGLRHARTAPAGTKGYHASKKHPDIWVRNRRMNVCNPRALRRSLRRAHGFAKLAMRTIHLVHPKKKGRFGGFRKRRAARV
jgi:hypothetical protein